MPLSAVSIAPVRSLALEHPAEIESDRTRGRRGSPLLPGRRHRHGSSTGCSSGRWSRSRRTSIPTATRLRHDVPRWPGHRGRRPTGRTRSRRSIHGRTGVGHVVDGPWAEALSARSWAGTCTSSAATEPGGTRNANAGTLITDGSLEPLGAAPRRRRGRRAAVPDAHRARRRRRARGGHLDRRADRARRDDPADHGSRSRAARSRPRIRTPAIATSTRSRHHRVPRPDRRQERRLRRPRRGRARRPIRLGDEVRSSRLSRPDRAACRPARRRDSPSAA